MVTVAGKSGNDDSGIKILERLRAALKTDGDFPVRARVVTELRNLANNPNANVEEISGLILREPSLGTRVLSLVNSAFYQRGQPIMTVTQAVYQLGMKSLSDLCAGFVLMQKFVPAAQRGGIFADAVKRTVLGALLSNRLASLSKDEGVSERGYLAGTFYNLSFLLLAYYFPQVYEAAARRAATRGQDTTKSITEILGISAVELSIAIVDALNIPPFYREVLIEAYKPAAERSGNASTLELARAIATAGRLSDILVNARVRSDVEQALNELAESSGIPLQTLVNLVDETPELFQQQANLIELGFLTLPECLSNFKAQAFGNLPEGSEEKLNSAQLLMARYVEELKFSVENGDPISTVVTTVMEAIVHALKFDRVVLLYGDSERHYLLGRMSMGNVPGDIRSFKREIAQDSMLVEVKAFNSGMPQMFGDPLFEDGWPFIALPIGGSGRTKGVIYADCVGQDEAPAISGSPLASFLLLTELLDQSVAAWE